MRTLIESVAIRPLQRTPSGRPFTDEKRASLVNELRDVFLNQLGADKFEQHPDSESKFGAWWIEQPKSSPTKLTRRLASREAHLEEWSSIDGTDEEG